MQKVDGLNNEQYFALKQYPVIKKQLDFLSGNRRVLSGANTVIDVPDAINNAGIQDMLQNVMDRTNFKHFKHSFGILMHEKALMKHYDINETVAQAIVGNVNHKNLNNFKRYQEVLELNNLATWFMMIYYTKLQNYTGPFCAANLDVITGDDPTFLSDEESIDMIRPVIEELSKLHQRIMNFKYPSGQAEGVLSFQVKQEKLVEKETFKRPKTNIARKKKQI